MNYKSLLNSLFNVFGDLLQLVFAEVSCFSQLHEVLVDEILVVERTRHVGDRGTVLLLVSFQLDDS